MGFSCGLFGGFGLILSWVFWWFGLLWCCFWVNVVVDYKPLKWVAVVMVGLCWVGGWIFVFFFFAELLWPLGKRGNLNGERKKNNKLLLYKATVTMQIMHGYCSKCVNMHIFTHTDVSSFEGKLCKFWHFLYFRETSVDALRVILN